MRWLKIILFSLLFFIILGVVAGIWLIRKNTFRLVEWTTPKSITQSSNFLPEHPNILLLVAEDMSAKVGVFGDSIAHTPNIDQLAQKGVCFPNTFTTAGVCSPSRAALITGMHQISIGAQHMRTATRPEGPYLSVPPQNVKAFPGLLRKAGYFTFNTAKQDYQFSGTTPGSGPFTIWDEENNQNLWRNRASGQPFFGMINFMETHESGIFTPLGHMPNSSTHLMMQVIRKLAGWQNRTLTVDPSSIDLPPYYPNSNTIKKDIARHYENIASMDALVGDIFQKLQKDGLLESTIIIWTTDHGDGLPRAKRELYDSGIKVPMVIYFPPAFRPNHMKVGTIDKRLISFVDIAPTILTLAKAAIPNFIQGQNFLQDTLRRNYIYASRDRIDEVMDRQRAVRNHKFKYIKSWYPKQEGGHPLAFRDNLEMMKELWKLKATNQLNPTQSKWFQAPGAEQFFNVESDPYELNDISTDTSYFNELKGMRFALDNKLDQIEDWSEQEENEMVNRFQENGNTKKTLPPSVKFDGKLLKIEAQNNASIGYRIDNEPWKLYIKPLKIAQGAIIRAKAVRYGWEESELIEATFSDKSN